MATTVINSNGSQWAGQEPLSIEALLAILSEHPLNGLLAPFIAESEVDNSVHFHGNFVTVSHVFSLHTNDQELVAALKAAIGENMEGSDYRPLPEAVAEEVCEEKQPMLL